MDMHIEGKEGIFQAYMEEAAPCLAGTQEKRNQIRRTFQMKKTKNTIQFCQVTTEGSAVKKYLGYVECDGYKENVFEFKPSSSRKQVIDRIADTIGDFSKGKKKSQQIWNQFKEDCEKEKLQTLEVQNGGQLESGKEIYKKLTQYIMEGCKNGTEFSMGICKDDQTIFIASNLLSTVLQEITGERDVRPVKKEFKNFLELNNLFRGNKGRYDCVINTPQGEIKCYRAWRFVAYREETDVKPKLLREESAVEKTDKERKGA